MEESERCPPFSPSTCSTILELGAHNGPNLLHYAREGHTVHGVEISDTLIATFSGFAARESPDIQARMSIMQGWIEDFEADETYDYVLVTEVLEHAADPTAILRVAALSLKQNGQVYVSSPSVLWGNNTHVRAVAPADLMAWLDAAGLTPTSLWESEERTFCYARRKSVE